MKKLLTQASVLILSISLAALSGCKYPWYVRPSGSSTATSGGTAMGEGAGAGQTAGTIAPEASEILAKRASFADLTESDRFVIVSEKEMRILSSLPTGRRLVGSKAHGDAENLTYIPDYTAVFTLERDEDGLVCFRSDGKYLTGSDAGNGLFLSDNKLPGSSWEPQGENLFYNPAAEYTADDTTYTNYYLEYYDGERCFSTYRYTEGENDPSPFEMSFYRLSEGFVPDDGSGYRLPVFETSDIHGYIADTSGEKTEYRLSWIADKVDDARRRSGEYREDTVVLLDGGDIFQGSTLSNLLEGEPMSAAFAAMRYDAVTIGNHEFDWGIENVVDADATMMEYSPGFAADGATGSPATSNSSSAGSAAPSNSSPAGSAAATSAEASGSAPTPAANKCENLIPVTMCDLYRDGAKVTFARDYVILDKTATDRDGNELPVRIGVIGFADNYASSIMYAAFTGAGYEIREDYDQLAALADKLEQDENCSAVILLTHADAIRIAEQLPPDCAIDLVLGGHIHKSDLGENENGIPYAMPAGLGNAFCYAELVFAPDESGAPVLQKVSGLRPVAVDSERKRLFAGESSIDELDEEITAITDNAIGRLDGVLNSTIGYITVPSERYAFFPESGERASTGSNWYTSLIARATGAEVAFVNQHGMRTDLTIPAGQSRRDVTISDVYTMFPFNNKLYLFDLTYAELLQVLEYSLTESGSGLFSAVTGVDCYFTDRTVNAIVKDGETYYANGVWRWNHDKDRVLVAASDYICTTNRRDGGLNNPLWTWKDTEKLIDSEIVDVDGALKALREEAAENDGALYIDTEPHYIDAEFSG